MRPGAGSARALALLALLGAARVAPLAAQAADPVLLELRLGNAASRTVEAFRAGDRALLPVMQLFEMGEVLSTRDSSGRVHATLQPGNIAIVIDPVAGRARGGRRDVPISATDVVTGPVELWLDATVLGELLRSPIEVSWPELAAVMADPSGLPIAQRLQRESARARLARPAATSLADRRVTSPRGRWDGFVLDYSWFSPSSDPLGGSSYAIAAGADLFGGSLEGALRSAGRAGDGDVELDASWLGVWRDNRYLRQVRIGDGPGGGLRPKTARGLYLTNAPYVRPMLLGAQAFRGRLPPGWQVEAYRGGQLVGLDSVGSDGSYGVDVPVVFGENPVEFIAYGPFGEREAFTRTYRAATALLRARSFEYALSAGGCRFDPCAAAANADFRYGLSRRWTVESGVERIWRDTLPNLVHPYAVATGSLTHAWTVQGEAVANGLARGAIAFEPTLHVRLGADYTRFDRDVVASLYNPLGREEQLRLNAFYRPDAQSDRLYFDATAELASTASGSTRRIQAGVSARAGHARVQPYLRIEREEGSAAPATSRAYLGLTAFFVPGGRVGPILRRSWIRASYESEGLETPRLASFTIARPIVPSVRLEAGVSWMSGQPGPAFALSLASSFDALRTHTTATAQRGAATSLTQYVQGSVVYDRSRRALAFEAGPSLQRAGIAGVVFLDANGNGRRDADEPGLPNVRVQVGSGSTWSDSLGAYRVWDVVPFEPVLVAADSLSFDSPLWVAGDRAIEVMPAPNHFTAVDVPLLTGAVLEGRVAREFGGKLQGVGGVSLVLTDRRTGRERRFATFTDGTFYTLGVTPGEYDLSVAPRVLDLLRAGAEPVRLVVPAGGESPPPADVLLVPRP